MANVGRVIGLAFGGALFAASVGGIVYLAAFAEDEVSATNENLRQLCEHPRIVIPDAPPYLGPGPHPIKVFGEGVTSLDSDQPSLRAVWNPKPTDVQVVGCVDKKTVSQNAGRTCVFDRPKPEGFRLDETTYYVSLYEARTRRKIADVTVPGLNCPRMAYVPASAISVEGQASAADFRQALSKYVDR